MATHSSILAWRIPWTEEPGGLQSMVSQELDTTERLHHYQSKWEKNLKRNGYVYLYNLEKEMATHSSTLAWRIPWREEPGGYSPWGHKESDTTEKLTAYCPSTILYLYTQI